MSKQARIDWRADRDGLAHVVSGRTQSTLCGARAVDERHAWPARARCERCVEAAGRLRQVDARVQFAAGHR